MHLILLLSLLLHPVHETVAEVEWNSQTNRMEVSLRLDALDEQSLTKSSATEHDVSTIAVKYLVTHFQVGDQPAFPKASSEMPTPKYHWVGRKPDGAFVWWHFEIEPVYPRRPTWIRQRMFFQQDQRYTNRVIVLDQKPSHVITLTADKPIARLDHQEDEPTVDDDSKEPQS